VKPRRFFQLMKLFEEFAESRACGLGKELQWVA
jgi:hypothetical protein